MLEGTWNLRVWIAGCLLINLHARLVAGVATRHLRRVVAAVDAPPYKFSGPSWKKPTGDFVPQSHDPADWPRERQKWRERLLSPTATFSTELDKHILDDEDTWYWRKYLTYDNSSTEYWDGICNGTNVSKANELPGDISAVNASEVLGKWEKQGNTTCSEFVNAIEYTDGLKAIEACGSLCDSISVTECQNQKYRLCATGEPGKNSTDNSCRFRKPNTYIPPAGLPRPPLQTKFWAAFCKYRLKGKKLRQLWPGKICASDIMKELASATNPVECHEVVAKDSDCSEAFDFRFGDNKADHCRCVLKNQVCTPIPSDTGDVWVPL